jgi:hypothetical protein
MLVMEQIKVISGITGHFNMNLVKGEWLSVHFFLFQEGCGLELFFCSTLSIAGVPAWEAAVNANSNE